MWQLLILCLAIIAEAAVIIYLTYVIKQISKYFDLQVKITEWWKECAEWWKKAEQTEKDYNNKLLKYIEGLESIHTPDEIEKTKIQS